MKTINYLEAIKRYSNNYVLFKTRNGFKDIDLEPNLNYNYKYMSDCTKEQVLWLETLYPTVKFAYSKDFNMYFLLTDEPIDEHENILDRSENIFEYIKQGGDIDDLPF